MDSFVDSMRAFLQQLRQETGLRMCDRVFDPVTEKPSKVNCFCRINDKLDLIDFYL